LTGLCIASASPGNCSGPHQTRKISGQFTIPLHHIIISIICTCCWVSPLRDIGFIFIIYILNYLQKFKQFLRKKVVNAVIVAKRLKCHSFNTTLTYFCRYHDEMLPHLSPGSSEIVYLNFCPFKKYHLKYYSNVMFSPYIRHTKSAKKYIHFQIVYPVHRRAYVLFLLGLTGPT
jgi:hypothetical protein